MGLGDWIMATADAKKVNDAYGVRVKFGDGRNAYWNEVFERNPRIAKELKPNERFAWIANYPRHRPYIDEITKDRLIFNPDFKALAGELFKVKLKDWREAGKRIVFIPAPPNPLWFHKDLKWNENYLQQLRQSTDREIFVKSAKTKGLGDSINKCYALVSHSSVAAVEAALEGVPIICTDTCPAYPIGNDITQINDLQTPNRDKWVNTLTYSQFTLNELRNGIAWQIIKEMNGL